MLTLRECSNKWSLFFLLPLLFILVSCGAHDPRKVDVELKKGAPEVKVTSYTEALSDLGLMTEIYGTGITKIQSEDISDHTGASKSTGGEIQRNITEMVKSTLNAIGGNIIFIEYNPSFIQNQMVTGYSNFDSKMIPDVVITGGITEFDRGLVTRGEGTDIGAEVEVKSGLVGSDLPSNKLGFEYEDSSKSGTARITLDFNMKNFTTLAGIAKMNTINSIEVHKAVRKKEMGVTIFGPTFGLKGSVKKVQGRHEAIRLLVQASMVQMVGKYLLLPYWRVLGEGNSPDTLVIDSLTRRFYQMSESERLVNIQEWLYLHGYSISITGRMNDQTRAALSKFDKTFDFGSTGISKDLFLKLYLTIPIDHETYGRATSMANLYQEQVEPVEQVEISVSPPVIEPPVEAVAPSPQPVAQKQVVEQEKVQAKVASIPPPKRTVSKSDTKKARVNNRTVKKDTPAKRKTRSIGRMLSDDEW